MSSRETQLRGERRYDRRARLIVIKAYGGKCTCCGETEREFLCIDHIEGGGNQDRQRKGKRGSAFYHWIISNNFPEYLRLLCHNCNSSYGFYGYCPHNGVPAEQEKLWTSVKGERLVPFSYLEFCHRGHSFQDPYVPGVRRYCRVCASNRRRKRPATGIDTIVNESIDTNSNT